ncbi:putative bacterial regulatory protein, arsR family protein [Nitrosopumilus adriaticus]|uniref:Putative bacterial regulatory protein, arsR family protein n=2 Tax=Nitrosopumilus adriaticus TaxID=1580092 RepID=A0A0D5C109_9ARCH|nr:AsnC family transcriptional regulator [Nitrosopumilus adriaticus]AJW70258.1 putative bacterial regulatory protein, arsR family protein [Nitrosopumilus adriaticus]
MTVDLDNIDVAIIKSLMQDGRKSFRAISRELKISTPTIKARYDRLVNMGLIKSVRPEIDISKISVSAKKKLPNELVDYLKIQKKSLHINLDNLKVKLECEFCEGPIHEKPKVLKFADIERFFCCSSCKNDYREKYGGRIQSLIEEYEENKKMKKA